jgi:hypothetical protein
VKLEKDVICKECNLNGARAMMTHNQYQNWLCHRCIPKQWSKLKVEENTPIANNNSDQKKKCEYCSQTDHSIDTCTAKLEKDVICKQCNVPAGRALMTYNEYRNWMCAKCLSTQSVKSNLKDDIESIKCDFCYNHHPTGVCPVPQLLKCIVCKDCRVTIKNMYITREAFFSKYHNWTCDTCLSAKSNVNIDIDIKIKGNETDNLIKTHESSGIPVPTSSVEVSQGYRPGIDCRFCKSAGHMINTCPVDTLSTTVTCYNCRYPTYTTITKDQIDNWLCFKCDNLEWSKVNSMSVDRRGFHSGTDCRFCYRNHTFDSCTAVVIKNVMCRYCPKYGISNLEKRLVTKEQLINYVCDSCASIEKITTARYFVTDDLDNSLKPYTGGDSITVRSMTQTSITSLSSTDEVKKLKDRLALINAIISNNLIHVDMSDGKMTNTPSSVIEETLTSMGFSIELYRSLKLSELTPDGVYQLRWQIALLDGSMMHIQIPNPNTHSTPTINTDEASNLKPASTTDKEIAIKEIAISEIGTTTLGIPKCEFCYQDGHVSDKCVNKARKQVKCRRCQYSRIEMVTIDQTNDWACNNCTRYMEFFQNLDSFPDQLADQEDDVEMDISLDKNVPYLHIQYLDNHGSTNSKIVKMPDCFDHWDFNQYGMIPESSYILKTLPYPHATIRVLFQMPIRLFTRK